MRRSPASSFVAASSTRGAIHPERSPHGSTRFITCLRCAAFPLAFALAACATPPAPPANIPNPADAGRRAHGANGAVATAHPAASEAAIAMLRAGGNAVDAAVAAAFAIGVVEPQMSGLGGGGAMLLWDAATRRAEYLDFYPMQPVSRFRDAIGFDGGDDLRVTGVPGNVAGLLSAHERFGTLPRAQVMAPAIRLAEDGFAVGQVLAGFIRSDSAKLALFPAAFEHTWLDGRPLPAGARLRNPELARTLTRIATEGRAGFYEGDVAQRVVQHMREHKHPVRVEDFAAYTPLWKRPLCIAYRGRHVLSAPPPQSGSQVLETLQLLESHDLPGSGLPTRSARAFDILASALRVGIADHSGANADPRWQPVHATGRISQRHAASRAALVGAGVVADSIAGADASASDGAAPEAGCDRFDPYTVATTDASHIRGDTATGSGETTHISVVDRAGNAVALTQTNSSVFGTGAFVAGFFLNNSGQLFRTEAALEGERVPWRTRATTIAPTIVLNDSEVAMVIGAPGGGRIPTEIVQGMVYMLDYGMDPLDAVRMPRVFPAAGSPRVQLEHGFSAETLAEIRGLGYEPVATAAGAYARLYVVMRGPDGWIAVADPRHDGEARALPD